MKKQILTLIIGILIGAIITAGVFLIFKGDSRGDRAQGRMGTPPSMDGNSIQEGEPPEKPDENGNISGNNANTSESDTNTSDVTENTSTNTGI